MPNFAMSIADKGSYTANLFSPRAVYFDVYIRPGVIYMPFNLEISTQETALGNSVSASSICSVFLLYTSTYPSCVDKNYMNNNGIRFYQT